MTRLVAVPVAIAVAVVAAAWLFSLSRSQSPAADRGGTDPNAVPSPPDFTRSAVGRAEGTPTGREVRFRVETTGPAAATIGWTVRVRDRDRSRAPSPEIRCTGRGSDVKLLDISALSEPECRVESEDAVAPSQGWQRVAPDEAEKLLHLVEYATVLCSVASDGVPVDGAHIRLLTSLRGPLGTSPATSMATAGQDGRAAFTKVVPCAGAQISVVDARYLAAEDVTFDLAPGEVRRCDFDLEKGIRLIGRVTDVDASPVVRCPVHVFVVERDGSVIRSHSAPGPVSFTDESGAFVTAAIPPASDVVIRLLVRRGNRYIVLHRPVRLEQDAGELNVGALTPLPTTCRIRVAGAPAAASFVAHLACTSESDIEGVSVNSGRLTWVGDEEITVCGIPSGDGDYLVTSEKDDRRWSSRITFTGDCRIDLDYASGAGEEERPPVTVTVLVQSSDRSPGQLFAEIDGKVRAIAPIEAGARPVGVALRLGAGEYRLFAVIGSTCGEVRATVGDRDQDVRLEAHEDTWVARVRVESGGVPVAGADVRVLGFSPDGRGVRGWELETARDGVATIAGLPAGVEGVRVAVTTGGRGRMYFVPRSHVGEFTVDPSATDGR